jgi:hypothetical protein
MMQQEIYSDDDLVGMPFEFFRSFDEGSKVLLDLNRLTIEINKPDSVRNPTFLT